MAFGSKPSARGETDNSRIAVLENRANQIDAHLNSTDAFVQKISDAEAEQGREIAEMQGEERMAFGGLGLLVSVNLIVVVKRPKKEDREV